jgi:signal transduction histidine kinase
MILPPLPLAALEALPQPISVVDAEGRLGYANRAFWRDAGVAPEACPLGTPLRDVVRLLAYRGLYGGGDPEAAVEAVMAVDRSRPSRRQFGRADGSGSFETVSVPLAGGGFVAVSHDITALLRAREEQAARARLLESTLAGLSGGVVRFDADLRLALFNPAYESLIGLPGGTLRGGMPHEAIIRLLDERGEFAADGEAAMRAEKLARDRSRASVTQRQRPSGEVLRFDSRPVGDGGFVVEVTDITALKRAEEEAKRRAALLDGVLEALPQGVCLYSPDRRVAMFNGAYARMMAGSGVALGESLDEVVARRRVQGEYDEATAAQVLSRFQPGALPLPPMRRLRPNGTVLENSMARLPDGGIISVFNDVTALHFAEAAARERAALLDGVLRALPHGVCVYGPDRRVAMFNAAYARIMDGSPIAVGEHIEEIAARRIAAGEFSEAYLAQSEARLGETGSEPEETVRVRPNGTVIAVRAARLADGGHISVVTDVTALRRAEEAARGRAELMDAALEALPDGVVVYGPDRRARFANAAYRRIMGAAAARIGESLEEVAERRVAAGEQTREMAETLLRRHAGPPEEAGRPVRRLRPDGTAIVTRAGRLPDGGHIAVISDVTALHQAEEELRRRAAILETSFAAMRHGLAIFGPDRRLLAANQHMGDMTGLPQAHFTPGRGFDELVDEQVELGLHDSDRGAAVKAADRKRPQRLLRAHPGGRVVEVISDPTPDGGFVIVYTDVTALHRAEEELRQRAAMQEAMLGIIRHGVILYGPDRRVRATNAKTSELTGMPPESLLPGRLMDELIDEQVARGQIAPAQAAEMKAYDRRRPLRYSRLRPDGRILDTVSEPTPDGGYAITYTDVTEERTIRAELERARAQAEAASEAKSRFLATMSHELRTPLGAVIGLSEAIAMERDPARIQEYAGMVNESGRLLLQLVDDILDVARSQTGALGVAEEPICSAEVIRAACAAAAPAAEAGRLSLGVTIDPALPALRCDGRRLRQVMDRLLSNAVKFTPAGGSIAVTAAPEAGGIAIRVADTGIGIPETERERVFEAFTQLDNSLARRFQGSGLGLHLARTLTSAIGGALTLEDNDGPGIVAVLRFPPARVEPAGAPREHPA